MPDYDLLLDDEVKAFLAKAETFYPPDAVDLSVAEQRRFYNAMCAGFDAGRPAGVRVEDKNVADVPCRYYEVDGWQDTLIYCHGGGFVVGDLDSHDSICAEFSAGAGLRVIAVDYRLSPEHPHPADFEDALAVFDAVSATTTGRIVLAGDSAGGNLVAAVSHARRRHPNLVGLLMIYPGLGGDWSLPSYIEHANAPGLTTTDMKFYMGMRTGGADKSGDPTYAPLHDTDFSGLPPTVAISAECDPLSSDSDVYVQALQKAGVPALWREEKGLVHAYLRARHVSRRAGASFQRMIDSLKALSKGELPTFD